MNCNHPRTRAIPPDENGCFVECLNCGQHFNRTIMVAPTTVQYEPVGWLIAGRLFTKEKELMELAISAKATVVELFEKK